MKKNSKAYAAMVGKVANNPRYDREYSSSNGMDADAIKDGKDHTIYGSNESLKKMIRKKLQESYGSRRTATGAIVPRDEPLEPQKTQHLKVADKKQFAKDLEFWKKRNQQSAARERLKKKGAVPIKSGKRLFEEFCREAYKNGNQNIDDVDMRNIYNSAQHLSYEKWIIFVSDEYGSSN